MRVGLVCPYSLDVPGGVQNHVVDLAETLLDAGHQVSVLAPADTRADLPPYVVPAGRAVPVPYNGSVARVAFGPGAAARTRRWLRDGAFDLLHVHEPTTPSLSLIALAASATPVVATFHTATPRSRAMAAASSVLRPALDKIGGRIAVSETARLTVAQHLGKDAVVIPNGIFVARFAGLRPTGRASPADPLLVFLGRFQEERKGLHVLLPAFERLVDTHPGARLIVAGRGDPDAVIGDLGAASRDRVTFTGAIDDADRSRLLAAADVFVAPNTGGESFGMILLEAMAAGAPVVASDLSSFRAVCADGRFGRHFRTGSSGDLAMALRDTLNDPLTAQRAAAAAAAAERYDWSTVGRQVVAFYDTVAARTPPGGPRRVAPSVLKRYGPA
jgi:phosphatidylinositol alpha-mannosyltransferase